MRAVIDTNVFVSGVFFSGPPHRILRAWQDGRVRVVVSPEILEEYRRTGTELASKYPGVDLGPSLRLASSYSEIVVPVEIIEGVCRDPDDDVFLSCAVAAGVSTIVSGDGDLLAVSGYRGIRVLRPRRFVDEYL